jgi:FixJ family two-component response regulator
LSKRQAVAIVDDDAPFREALGELLSMWGLAVHPFAAPEALLSEADLSRYDVFLLDFQMPGLNGVDLRDRIRERGAAAPVIFITSYAEEVARRRAAADGALAVLSKPFDVKELAGWLQAALGPGWRPA